MTLQSEMGHRQIAPVLTASAVPTRVPRGGERNYSATRPYGEARRVARIEKHFESGNFDMGADDMDAEQNGESAGRASVTEVSSTRVRTGIAGLDTILGGGLLPRQLYVVEG